MPEALRVGFCGPYGRDILVHSRNNTNKLQYTVR
jgi:hypothetical protein